MKLKEKLELLRAGYTKKEIEDMAAAEAAEEQAAAQAAQAAAAKKSNEPATPEDQIDLKGLEDRINGRINDLIQTMQESNLLNASSGQGDQIKTGADAIKDILGGKEQ